MTLTTLPITGLFALCDDLRQRAPKQTALTVRYLVTILSEPGLKVSDYHLLAASNPQYSHGNTILKGLHDLGYIELTDPDNPTKGSAEVTELARTTLNIAPTKPSASPSASGVSIQRHPDRLCVTSPYHPALPAKAGALKARWHKQGGYWEFPVGIEPDVRELYETIFSEYDAPSPRTTITCTSPFGTLRDADTDSARSIFIAGKEIASITKQGRLRLGQGVTVQSGGIVIETVEGEQTIVTKENTSIRIEDVPLAAAEKLEALTSDKVKRVDAAHA